MAPCSAREGASGPRPDSTTAGQTRARAVISNPDRMHRVAADWVAAISILLFLVHAYGDDFEFDKRKLATFERGAPEHFLEAAPHADRHTVGGHLGFLPHLVGWLDFRKFPCNREFPNFHNFFS